MLVLAYALAASAATLAGGAFALRLRDRLHLVLGFSAGAVAGVALFDLLPEAIVLNAPLHSAATLALFIALGFFGYLLLDRAVLLCAHTDEAENGLAPESHAHRGGLGATALSAHSFLDGIAIGIGFQASAAVGLVIAAAVLTHDFSDGINTVNLVLKEGAGAAPARRWLLADAAAPVAGAAATLLFHISGAALGLVLAVFVGTFLYLSASDLIPESHHRHPRILTTLMTLIGAGVLYLIVRLAT